MKGRAFDVVVRGERGRFHVEDVDCVCSAVRVPGCVAFCQPYFQVAEEGVHSGQDVRWDRAVVIGRVNDWLFDFLVFACGWVALSGRLLAYFLISDACVASLFL